MADNPTREPTAPYEPYSTDKRTVFDGFSDGCDDEKD